MRFKDPFKDLESVLFVLPGFKRLKPINIASINIDLKDIKKSCLSHFAAHPCTE